MMKLASSLRHIAFQDRGGTRWSGRATKIKRLVLGVRQRSCSLTAGE